ncbi:DNA-binding HxlR family transcriptional regulator [Paenibacillus amylolyticus]|uniref:DNA-binding HxlR family transcriptional regulator n=1 Tax=Paenibacillus amylolyticus TaxID=1451 RepID=A0AAP5LK46_PAEAM|nr:helix-turn-helix domain-containing protein [Paenibacillus amylolyticus]MDR6721596.1 DNA-binding HxlR family transcriptional regulator [Paenibacillus amylolyticus]
MAKMEYTPTTDNIDSSENVRTCAIAKPQNMIAGKWKLTILWLISMQTRRFNELQRLLPGISKGILTRQLRELETDGLIHREVYKEVPPKVEYSLTALGDSFMPILTSIAEWGKRFEQHEEDKQLES